MGDKKKAVKTAETETPQQAYESLATRQRKRYEEPSLSRLTEEPTSYDKEQGLELDSVPAVDFILYLAKWADTNARRTALISAYDIVVRRVGISRGLYQAWIDAGELELERIIEKRKPAIPGGWARCREIAKLERQMGSDFVANLHSILDQAEEHPSLVNLAKALIPMIPAFSTAGVVTRDLPQVVLNINQHAPGLAEKLLAEVAPRFENDLHSPPVIDATKETQELQE